MNRFLPALLMLGVLAGAAALPRRREISAKPPEGDPAETIVFTSRGLVRWPDMVSWARH